MKSLAIFFGKYKSFEYLLLALHFIWLAEPHFLVKGDVLAQNLDSSKTILVSDIDLFQKHQNPVDHPESSSRILAIAESLKQSPIEGVVYLEPRKISKDELNLVHPDSYVDFIRNQAQGCEQQSKQLYKNDSDVFISKGTRAAAEGAVGGLLAAIDQVMVGRAKNAFVASRPPGHHALPNQAMGFCFYNNVAIGAKYLLKQYGKKIRRVLIVDWDLHHGNGTQHIFREQQDVFYFSVHLEGAFPQDDGESLLSTAHIMNRVIARDADRRAQVLQAFHDLEQAMKLFQPDFVLISAGFDGHVDEFIEQGGLGLSSLDFRNLTQIVMNIAGSYAGGRLVSILEGGYQLQALADGVKHHVECLVQCR